MILLAKIQINDREKPSLLEYFSKRYRKSLRKKDCHAASALCEILDFSPYGRRPKGSDATLCQDDT